MFFLLISLSVLGLFAGAGLVALGRLRLGATSALEGLALGMLPALVLLRLVPHAYESLGLWALALAAVGFAAVSLSHHAGERAEARLGRALVLPALLLHAMTDGAALAISNTGRVGAGAGFLALAAILHRIPEGFFIASRQHARGPRAALLAAAPLALATIAGAVLGQRIFEVLPDSALDGVLAVGAGAMLRLFVHSHDEAPTAPPPAARAIAAAALLCGVIIVVAVPGPHDVLQSAQPRELSVAQSLLPLFIESAPALLLGLLLSSVLRAQTQRRAALSAAAERVASLSGSAAGGPHSNPPRNHASSALRGWAYGLIEQTRAAEFPALLGQLRSPGAAPALIAGFCVATSQLGVETLSLSLAWLGPRVTLASVAGSVLLALALGSALSLRGQPAIRTPRDSHDHPAPGHGDSALSDSATRTRTAHPPSPQHAPPQHATSAAHDAPRPRFGELLQQALDDSGPFIVLGLLLSAALEAALTPELLQQLPEPWDSALACALALVGRISALGITPVVAVLLHKGLALGPGLTLLWLSPLASIPLALWLGRRPSSTEALLAGSTAAALCIALGEVVERTLTMHGVPELHPLVTHDCSPWEYASAAVLGLLLMRSLVRLGPRGFASTRPPPATSPERTLCALPH